MICNASVPAPVLMHYVASPSSVAWIMYQKYRLSVPLYRQERDFRRMGAEQKRYDGKLGHTLLGILAEAIV